jgi:hypothetical protein
LSLPELDMSRFTVEVASSSQLSTKVFEIGNGCARTHCHCIRRACLGSMWR